jgi:hypothetical protein
MNKYRLTTNSHLIVAKRFSIYEIENLLNKLYLTDSPYEIKQGIRYYRNTNKLVSEATNITVIDSNNNKVIYNSMSECAKELNISRTIIKNCLIAGKSYKGYNFVLN